MIPAVQVSIGWASPTYYGDPEFPMSFPVDWLFSVTHGGGGEGGFRASHFRITLLGFYFHLHICGADL